MKNFYFLALSISFFILLTACSSDDENNTTYLDNKLIEGVWHRELKTDYDKLTIDSTVYRFENDMAYSLYYAKIAGLDTLKFEGKTELNRYLLTDSIIFFPDSPYDGGLKIRYKLQKGEVDSLFLYNSAFTEGYLRIEK